MGTSLIFMTQSPPPQTHEDDGLFNVTQTHSHSRHQALVLVFLVLARVQAAYDTENKSAMIHNAAVHVVEALAFGREYYSYGAKGAGFANYIIFANAAWFVSVAMRM